MTARTNCHPVVLQPVLHRLPRTRFLLAPLKLFVPAADDKTSTQHIEEPVAAYPVKASCCSTDLCCKDYRECTRTAAPHQHSRRRKASCCVCSESKLLFCRSMLPRLQRGHKSCATSMCNAHTHSDAAQPMQSHTHRSTLSVAPGHLQS